MRRHVVTETAGIYVEIPCITCDGLLTAAQVPGVNAPTANYNFGADLIEADLEISRARRFRNPRIL
jgi:hypothetical protein